MSICTSEGLLVAAFVPPIPVHSCHKEISVSSDFFINDVLQSPELIFTRRSVGIIAHPAS